MKLTRKLVSNWRPIGCTGHLVGHHKWWVVVLFWVAVALAVFAVLVLVE